MFQENGLVYLRHGRGHIPYEMVIFITVMLNGGLRKIGLNKKKQKQKVDEQRLPHAITCQTETDLGG